MFPIANELFAFRFVHWQYERIEGFSFLSRFVIFVKKEIMARIAGIKTKRDNKGRITEITINTKKHPQAIELLQQAGLVEKTKFQQELEQGLTVEQARQRTLAKIRSWKWPK